MFKHWPNAGLSPFRLGCRSFAILAIALLLLPVGACQESVGGDLDHSNRPKDASTAVSRVTCRFCFEVLNRWESMSFKTRREDEL